MMATHDTVAVMPGSRVTDRGTVPGLDPEDDPGDHGSSRATASRGNMDCRVKPGNDSTPLDAGLWLAGQER
jgi:hypothetical protein